MSYLFSRHRTSLLAIGASLILAPQSQPAHAWAIGSQLENAGCHEPITAQALRTVRTTLDTAPVLTPTRDEAAMIADVLFAPPSDFVNDLAGMTLLLGVRDNDLKVARSIGPRSPRRSLGAIASPSAGSSDSMPAGIRGSRRHR